MDNFSQKETYPETIKKISNIGLKILSKDIRKITYEKKTIQTYVTHSQIEKNIKKIFEEKILLI